MTRKRKQAVALCGASVHLRREAVQGEVKEVAEFAVLAVDVGGLPLLRAAVLPPRFLFLAAHVEQARRDGAQLAAVRFLKETHVVGGDLPPHRHRRDSTAAQSNRQKIKSGEV